MNEKKTVCLPAEAASSLSLAQYKYIMYGETGNRECEKHKKKKIGNESLWKSFYFKTFPIDSLCRRWWTWKRFFTLLPISTFSLTSRVWVYTRVPSQSFHRCNRSFPLRTRCVCITWRRPLMQSHTSLEMWFTGKKSAENFSSIANCCTEETVLHGKVDLSFNYDS